ncbi:uncharacterized protein LOC123311995 [Coccinella septempunctata]|uniref:uncharacterized protein LOC123311995 n=1 Tax=Coccinella septempunctata TaxID=41139 RepID=UPI001D08D1E3|nr:uncharacterized protein LOC123311995 [Coccinella septempunctata]
MVNGNVDKNNTSTNTKPDEESTEQEGVASSLDTTASSSRKSSDAEPPSDNHKKVDVGDGEAGTRAMAEVSTKIGLFCNVPLNKIRLSSEEESSSKIKQVSRKLLCLYCDRSFVSSNLRQKHVERCHSEKQNRRLSSRKLQSQFTTTACFHCDKLPVEHSLRQLFEHLVSAHSQKYFGCLLCEERFLNQIHLNDHNTKLHNLSQKEHQKVHLVNIDDESKNDEANRTSSTTEDSKGKEQKSTKNNAKKKKSTTNAKPPPRQLRNRKKVTVKASKVGLKRSKRLQSAQNKVPVRKKKTKAVESAKSDEITSKTTDKAKTSAVNPYPEFDNYYRVKKITDHSIDNLKISSLTFDDVFDKAFFNRIKCNIQENLLYHLDGKLFKNEESESRISNFEKNPPTQEISSNSSENFGCDLSLNAVTPVTSILTSNFGEDLESQIEYGSKPSKKKLQIRQDPVRHKYVTRRKYQASILEHKENRDLSKLDMWTQLIIKDRQQKVLNGQKSAKEILEYTTCAEYKLKIQRNELNRILDRRGPFEDLKEEASKKAALEQLNSDSNNEISEECFKEVRILMEDLLSKVSKNCFGDQDDTLTNIIKLDEKADFLDKEDIPELPDYLKLRRKSSAPSEDEIDKSDRIALICSSQETENYELPTNTVRSKDEMVELSGEWARSRIYVCAACGLKVPNMKLLIDHKSIYHQNSWVQHYELVGNQSELYRHLCIPGLGKVGHVEETIPCKAWLKSESRVCTKCGKVCNSLSELHRHILECGGDWTWMLARKKCKYRPFGARKKRRGLVKRIRVSNQKTDQTEKKKYKKTFEGPRQRPSDADTIQRMLANLPPKRSSRKSICMKDGFPRNRQKSPKNKKQVMKCGKIVRHKSTYDTNEETAKKPSNHKNASIRHTVRSISRTLSSKILDTNSKLKVKRQLIQKISRRSPRKSSQNELETTDEANKNEETAEKRTNIKKNINNAKTKKEGDLDRMKCILKEKVNMKTFFPVSKRKASKNPTKLTENLNSDTSQLSLNIEVKNDADSSKNKATKNVINLIKKSLNITKKVKVNSKNDANMSGNSEPIVVIEKLPQEQTEMKPIPATKKVPTKRKLRSSFRKVIDKVKKLKLDNTTSSIPNEKNQETTRKPVNSFLGHGAREKEKLATVLVPLVEELKENPPSNLAFVQNAMDNNSPTEESLIPENIFNLQHNTEDLLQAKSPLDTITNELKKNETMNYFSTMSAKVSNLPESKTETSKKSTVIESGSNATTPNQNSAISPNEEASQVKGMSQLSIETAAKSDKSPLVSPMLSPSMLSPKLKGKIRKPNRGLNDCIAMLTKKAFEETHKSEVVSDLEQTTENTKLDNTNEAHKIIRANECILKIPVIETNSLILSEVLDLSKPKKSEDANTRENTKDSLSLKPTPFWNPLNEMCNSQNSVKDSKLIWQKSSPNTVVNSSFEKAILKIPKFIEVSRSNNVDNIIQGVIENYDEPNTKADMTKSYLKVPSVGLLTSVDRVIEEVVRGNFTSSSNEAISKTKSAADRKSLPKENNIVPQHTSSKSKKVTKKNKQDNNSSNNEKIISANVSCLGEGADEGKNQQNGTCGKLDIPQIVVTPSIDLVVSGSPVKSIDMSYPGSSLEAPSVKESTFKEESKANDTLDGKIVHTNSDIVDMKNVSVSPVCTTVKRKTGKKIGEVRRRTSKKPLDNSKDKVAQSKSDEYDIEKIELNLKTQDILPIFPQTNEPEILEEKQLPVNDNKIITACTNISPIQPCNGGNQSSSEGVADTESHELHGEQNEVVNNLEENSKNKISILEQIEITEENNETITVDTSAAAVLNAEVVVSENNEDNDLKANSTDSEDDLPLLVLKSRSKKSEMSEASPENTKEISTSSKYQSKNIEKNEEGKAEACRDENIEKISDENVEQREECITEIFESSLAGKNVEENTEQSKEENSEKLDDESLKITESTAIETPPNNLLTENEKHLDADQCSSIAESESNFKQGEDRRKSPRKISNSVDTKPRKNGKKSNKQKQSSKHKVDRGLEATIDEVNVTEKMVEQKEQPEKCCANTSDEVLHKDVDVDAEISSVLKPLDTVVIDTQKKSKNFLVDASAPNFTNSVINSPLFSMKSSKNKKKDKNKHDSVKTKLIFKFPKIILKEPVLRIPPRDISDCTSFVNKTESSQDKGIKLILDNPFSSIKDREATKILSITNKPDVPGKSTEHLVAPKLKTPNKKKSSKHKKKSSKSSVKGDEKEIVDEIHQNTLEDTNTSSHSNLAINKDLFTAQDNKTMLDDFDLPLISPDSRSIQDIPRPAEQKDKIHDSSKVIQPITLKLQASSLKKCASKNSRKKKNKLTKPNLSSIASELDDKTEENYFPSSEESEMASIEKILPEIRETKELSTHEVKEIEEAVEKSSHTKIDAIDPLGSETANIMIPSKIQEENIPEQPTRSDNTDKSNLGIENKESIPVKSGRSLRSTVKITYKQSNIFALQIEDKEISDLKIMEKPKNFQIKNGSCSEMLLSDEKKLEAVVESNDSQPKDFISKEVPDYDSFQSDIKTSSDKKFITDLDPQLKKLQNKDTVETAIESLSISSQKTTEGEQDLTGDYSKLNSLNTVKPDAEIEMPVTKSKKNKRSSKTKKVSSKISDCKMDTSMKYCEISEEKVTRPFITASIIETNISNEVLDIQTKTQSSNGNISQTESVVQEESPQTHEEEPIEDLLASGKYEDSSFSEGELVINESFENQESNILEEPNLTEDTFETSTTEINNLPEEKEEAILDTECSVMEQKKQKNKKNKKAKRSKSKEIPHTENHSLKAVEAFNSNENSSTKTNDYLVNKELCEKVESIGVNKLEDIDSELNDAIKNLYQDSLSVNLAHKKKDEFEFEEDALPICVLAPKLKKKKPDVVKYQDDFMDSIPLCKEKQESASSSSPHFDIDLQVPSLDSGTVRRQRSAKSKALENINVIEKKLDQILDMDVSPKLNSHKEKSSVHPSNKKKVLKNKEAITENTLLKDTIKWTPKDIPTEENKIEDTPCHRKGRAAKSKAIQNIKVLETKTIDFEDIDENVKKSQNTDENEKFKKIAKSKDKHVPRIESNENMIDNHFTEKNTRNEKISKKENKIEAAPPLPLSSAPVDTSLSKIKEVLKLANKKNVNELNKYPWVQRESELNKLEENDSVCEASKKTDEISSVEKIEGIKSKITKEKIVYENDKPKTNSEMESIKNSISEIGDYYLENLFSGRISTGEKLDNHQKQKIKDNLHGPFDTPSGKDRTDCYDIANIDEENDLEDQVSFSLSPSKKQKKPTKNRQLHVDEIKENHLKISEDTPITKNRGDKVLEHIHNISQITDVNTTDLIDSLDVTLKTTVDEISSILMEKRDEPDITNYSKENNFGETKRLQTNKSNESRKHRNGKKPSNDEQKSSQIFDEKSDKACKKKRNRDSSFEESTIGKEKVQNLEMRTSLEMESKRRSKRACKVNTYNENELAEAIFEQAASEKEKAKKKRADEVINDSSSSASAKKITASDVSTEKKLNTDELFDLLKATAPDNLIALKPVEESPSNTPITDDTFDDEFDDILRKSQALFGEKPYKKLDDICRSDDSSNTSKLTDFERSEDNTESNDLLKKSTHNYIDDTFNNSVSSISKSQTDKSEEISTSQSDDLYCDICKKSFKRIDNLIKHRTTLTHIAKLSEIEAKEAQNKLRVEVQINDDSSYSNVDIDCQKQTSSRGYSYPSNTGNDALKIAEIITEALEKPAPHADRGFSEIINPLPEYRRYKSLGERKSFEYDQDSPNLSENIDANHYEPKISKNTGVILEKQITLLQNIVGLDYANDASTSSFRSLGNSVASPISEVSTKLEDSTNHVFPIDLERETVRTRKIEGFLKPPQIEDISEDSVNPRNSEDIKSRKVLNRDEELFLECCSLLKSGSEVSNFSKKSNRNSFLNNIPIRMSEEPDVLETKNVVYKITENSSDYSRRATPLGDSFGDTSNSNTISSSWEMNKNDQLRKNQENFFNFGETEKKAENDQSCFDTLMTKSPSPTDTSTKPSKTKHRKSNLAVKLSKKRSSNFNKSSSKMPTKGAMKNFEGLKVSIQASEMKLDSLKKNMSLKKQENNGSEKTQSENKFVSPKSPRRKSKPVKNKPQIDDRFIFKVNKKTSLKDAEETISKSSKETITDKVSDVYDFEETQDNTDVFAKPDFKSFRTKGTDAMKEENTLENNYEAQTMSSSSSSNLSCKKAKSNECITKKKHMIMGRIFKNAVKPKLDEEIRDIPAIDHNELVENYVMNCTPKHEEEEFKKPKMTEEEMNDLFDKLLDKPAESPKKSCNTNKTDKNNGTKKKLKTKCKKRHRSNSDSTDDEFGLNRIVKKRPSRKNAKEEDNSINLEQELKECIGVASRKSQRKCTSGKQNVLVEYWSSDESAFETFLENHLQELSEKSDLPTSKDAKEKQEEGSKIPSIPTPKENPSKSSGEKSKKSKSKVLPKKKEIKESTASNEVSETLGQPNRRKRTAAHPLYHWSSSSEDELHDMIEVKSIRDDPEDEYDEERPVQHGWIVGDSPKKLVTMLAQAKGKKTEPESLVKEQGKKKNSNS